jgi:hypothetical protein
LKIERALEFLDKIEELTEDYPYGKDVPAVTQDLNVHQAFVVIRLELLRRKDALS